MRGTAGGVLLGLWLLLAGCPSEEAPPAPPAKAEPLPAPGVIALVDDVEIHAVEVERLAGIVQAVFPEYSDLHTRRLALTEALLPRAAARSKRGAEWERARAESSRAFARLQETGAEAWLAEVGPPLSDTGGLSYLRLDLWGAARGAELGVWMGPYERIGTFTILRVIAIEGEEFEEKLTVERVEFPYLPEGSTASDLNEAIDSCRLRIVDPDWEEAFPERWKYRMRGE